ncbi:MAG TPA: FkbM family methyltransferase [Terriglobales bacterium]|jgi:FkbM family methyltransferase|nr:FkbM family methyltransferase [Terriglobales bacterium]
MNSRAVIKRALSVLPQSWYVHINAYVASRDIANGKRWEPEIERVREIVRDGETVIDVGANHGLYAFHLSKMVGASGRVHCFEPIPPNYFVLRHTVESLRLTNVTTHNVACGESRGKLSFGVPIDKSVPQWGWAHQGSAGHQFSCEVVPLDEVVAGRASFIKCDVEGAELFVFRGAKRILRESTPAVLVESVVDFAQRFNYHPQDFFNECFRPLGYTFFRSDGRRFHRTGGFTESGNYLLIH